MLEYADIDVGYWGFSRHWLSCCCRHFVLLVFWFCVGSDVCFISVDVFRRCVYARLCGGWGASFLHLCLYHGVDRGCFCRRLLNCEIRGLYAVAARSSLCLCLRRWLEHVCPLG